MIHNSNMSIPSPVMCNKGNSEIAVQVGALVNEEVSNMHIVKSHH